jgi:hypothetical protein
MTRYHPSRWASIAPIGALAGALLAAACSTAPTRYYSLAEATQPARPVAAAPLFIELAPVAMPERFARPELVVRAKDSAGGAQVSILEERLWASSFESELHDALASGIANRLGAVDISRAGRAQGRPAVRVAVQLLQFDAVVDSRVDAAFSWTLRRTDEGPVAACQLSLSEPVGVGVDALAEGARRLTSRLADAIAASVSAQQAGKQPVCAAG